MSGVFALLDPAGVDHEASMRAMSSVVFRGEPSLLSSGVVAVGTYLNGSSDSSRVRNLGDRLVATDATINGPVAGTRAAWRTRGLTGSDFLEDVLEELGPAELIGVAGDFAVASAEPERSRIVVARDAFGARPLLRASKGGVHAFASDVEVLLALGLVGGELDPEVISAFLAIDSLGDADAARTAFAGVRTVLAGHWVEVAAGHEPRERRWFVPWRLAPPVLGRGSGVAAVHDVLVEATAARAVGRNVGLQLSGGRDSGAIAVALRDAGIHALCLTYSFDSAVQRSETELAQSLATHLGHDWMPVPCDAPSRDELETIPWGAGTPLVASAWTLYLRTRGLAETAGVDVLLTGDGGEPLFQASPRSVVDLMRQGRVRDAVRASRNYHRLWTYPYRVQAKGALRLIAPRHLLEVRERVRPIPPWVVDRISTKRGPLLEFWNERSRLVRALTTPETYSHDYGERLGRRHGIGHASPMLDLRVLRVVLGLPLELRAPVSAPKPALHGAFLQAEAPGRVKMSLAAYFQHVALTLQREQRDLFAPDSLSVRAGFVRPEGLDAIGKPEWLHESANLAVVEMWLRTGLDWSA